ncbi:MAG: glycosyltransferase family 2 protein [Candidatus Moranbacteria bacterium]|nr:glycosyltransferase family 2 protein [Candidatus Moranbacteria bacterium]
MEEAKKAPKDWQYPNPRTKDPTEHKWQRFFESIPGALTWTTLLGMIILSYLAAAWVAVFIILYDVYWFHRTIYIATYSILAYKKMSRSKRADWLFRVKNAAFNKKIEKRINEEIEDIKKQLKQKIKRKERKLLKKDIKERKDFLAKHKRDYQNKDQFLNWREIYHVVMLPTATEGAEIIEPALEALDKSNYPNDRIIILLALEEREPEERRQEKVKILKGKFGRKFCDFLVTVHKVQKGEMKCKASNTTYAAKQLKKYLEENKIPLEKVVLSNFDCDTQVHPEFLGALTYEYMVSPNRLRQAYQPLPMYHNNIWDTIAPVRVIVTGSSFWHMVESMRPEHMVTFSSHSEPFKTIVDVNYWPVNVISEDSVIYWKAYDYFAGDYQVKPIYLPVSLDAVLGQTYRQTVANQYKQKRRWAYGIENFPLLARAFRKNKKLGWGKKIKHLFTMLEGHHSWATAPFILALLGWLPLILGGESFNESVLAHNLPYITRTLMTIALVGLVVSMFLSFLLMPPRPKRYSKKRYLSMFFQWFLAPFIAPFLGAMPAVDAQTRIMLGKYFGEFWITEKFKKK